MSGKDLFAAIQSRDLKAIADRLMDEYERNDATYSLCDCGRPHEPLAVFHGIGCRYRTHYAADLRARLDLESRDEPRYRSADEQAADDAGIPLRGPL